MPTNTILMLAVPAVERDPYRRAVAQDPGQRHGQGGPLADAGLQLLAGVDQLDVAAEAGGVEEGPAVDPADVYLRGLAVADRLHQAGHGLDPQVAGQVVEGPGGTTTSGSRWRRPRRPPLIDPSPRRPRWRNSLRWRADRFLGEVAAVGQLEHGGAGQARPQRLGGRGGCSDGPDLAPGVDDDGDARAVGGGSHVGPGPLGRHRGGRVLGRRATRTG